MKALLQHYIRAGSLYSEEYVELNKELDLPFTPFIGLKFHLPSADFSHHLEFVARLRTYSTLASGILSVEEAYYNVEENSFLLTSWELAGSAEDLASLADQWQNVYGFTLVGHFGASLNSFAALHKE